MAILFIKMQLKENSFLSITASHEKVFPHSPKSILDSSDNLMKTKQPTELAATLSSDDDMRKDVVAKHLFSINEVVAWLLKSCVPEYSQMEVSDIIREQLAKADIRLGTEPVGQDVRLRVPIVGTEDNSVTDGTVYYDLRTELPLPGAFQKSPLLILDVEMQKDYDSWLLFYKRVIYYIF